jgi:DNA excision repair protein ERCC-4
VNGGTSGAVSPRGLRDAALVLTITADVHEQRSGIPGRLASLGADVTVVSLVRGDYVVGPSPVVERKTIADLHASVAGGRLWQQMRRISDDGRPYLLIEGRSIFAGAVAPDAIRGMCLALIDLGVALIRSDGPMDSARWLARLADRRRAGAVRVRPPHAQRPPSPDVSPMEAALSAAPGVSTKTARTVLERFGSIAAVADATVEDLTSLPNVGKQRAQAIVALIQQQWNAANNH